VASRVASLLDEARPDELMITTTSGPAALRRGTHTALARELVACGAARVR
jgi:hypothetical protein